jgi:hypothetical protein
MLVTFGVIDERGLPPDRPRVACASVFSPGNVGSAGNDEVLDPAGGGLAVALEAAVAVGVAVAAAVGALAIVADGCGVGCADAMLGAAAWGAAGAATGGRALVTQRFEEEHPAATIASPSAQVKRR